MYNLIVWKTHNGYRTNKPQKVLNVFKTIDNDLFSTQGRNGKGAIYVFAAGNGGKEDNCNADGYVSNLYTIPITSIGIDGKAAYYSEVCASAFAATYSGISERELVSINLFYLLLSVAMSRQILIVTFMTVIVCYV